MRLAPDQRRAVLAHLPHLDHTTAARLLGVTGTTIQRDRQGLPSLPPLDHIPAILLSTAMTNLDRLIALPFDVSVGHAINQAVMSVKKLASDDDLTAESVETLIQKATQTIQGPQKNGQKTAETAGTERPTS